MFYHSSKESYGRVRSISGFSCARAGYLDTIFNCGWHDVNEKYMIQRPHGAATWLMLFTVSGKGEAQLLGQWHQLLPETCLLIPPDTPCMYTTAEGSRWVFYWIHLSGNQVDRILRHCLKTKSPVIPLAVTPLVSALHELIENTDAVDDGLYSASFVSRFLMDFLERVECGQDDRGRRLALDMMRDIDEEKSPFSLSRLCGKYFLSEEHIIRLFKKETGNTPYQYFRRRQLEKAAHLLAYTEYAVSEIARQLGYGDSAAFCKQFKKEYGCSPLNYRNDNRN